MEAIQPVAQSLLAAQSLLLAATSVIFAATVGHAAGRSVLSIDPETSSFEYGVWYGAGGCPWYDTECVAQTGWIDGRFAAVIEPWQGVAETIRFEPLDVVTPPLVNGVFHFPQYRVLTENGEFLGNGDPCNFWEYGGTCYSLGNFGYVSGSFDGHTLTMVGAAPVDRDHSYHFLINAVVVPEPISMWLFLGTSGCVLGWARARDRRRSREDEGMSVVGVRPVPRGRLAFYCRQ
jgi:hypothetical protein